MSNPSPVFLYAEFQNSVPFTEAVWKEANVLMQEVPGLLTKTWLSGVGNSSVGGFYSFDSVESADAYARGLLSEFAKASNASLTVKLFDGDVVATASRSMQSPFYG
ncbi:MAG: YdhR family protein [Rhizobium sp.]|nr:YdhR family protein [Rhizobium sp.]